LHLLSSPPLKFCPELDGNNGDLTGERKEGGRRDEEIRCGAYMWVPYPPQLIHHVCCQLSFDKQFTLVRITFKIMLLD
jgi:hypothetical protein